MLSLAGSYTCKAAVIRCEQSYRSVWHNNHNNLDSWSLYLLSTFISVWSSSVKWCWKLCKNLRSELWMRLFCQLQDGFIIIILYIMKGSIATNILLAQKLLKWKKNSSLLMDNFIKLKGFWCFLITWHNHIICWLKLFAVTWISVTKVSFSSPSPEIYFSPHPLFFNSKWAEKGISQSY